MRQAQRVHRALALAAYQAGPCRHTSAVKGTGALACAAAAISDHYKSLQVPQSDETIHGILGLMTQRQQYHKR